MVRPIGGAPPVRRITEHAYRAGALLVTTFYSDDPSVLARYDMQRTPASTTPGLAA